MKVGHVSTVGMNYFPCVVSWNKLWKLIMQLVRSKNCPALCLDSSGLILVVSAHPLGATGKGRISFHYKYVCQLPRAVGQRLERGGLVTAGAQAQTPKGGLFF